MAVSKSVMIMLHAAEVMSMPKFSPGDPVWVHQIAGLPSSVLYPPGEHATTIIRLVTDRQPWWNPADHYEIDLPRPADCRRVVAPEWALRPRRDDYQQHEPLGTRADLGKAFYEEVEKEVTSGS